jgi:hypothetical protein
MQLTIKPTDRLVVVDDAPCRIWQGTTDRGTPVHVYIRAFAVAVLDCKEDELAEFKELMLSDDDVDIGRASQFGLAADTTFKG